MTRCPWLLFPLVLLLAFSLFGCEKDETGDDDDDDDDATDEDKVTILCDKLDACGFLDDLEIDDCETFGEGLSDWLMDCAMLAEGCGGLADCFNIPEGV